MVIVKMSFNTILNTKPNLKKRKELTKYKKQLVKNPKLKYLKKNVFDYLEASSLHGFKYVGQTNISIVERYKHYILYETK